MKLLIRTTTLLDVQTMVMKYLLLAFVLRVSVFASQNIGTDDSSIQLISTSIEQSSENELIFAKKKGWRKSPFSDKTMKLKRHLQEDETCQDSMSFQFISYGDKLRTCKWLKRGNKKRQKRKQKNYCPRVIDGVRISDQCKQSCGLCSTCSYRCFQKKYVCEHDTMCSNCANIKPLHRTCKNLWDKCGDSSDDTSIYGGLDCSNVKALDKCYMENIEEDYRETLVKYDWSMVEHSRIENNPGPKDGRFDWFLTRKPFEPIVNDTTVIAGVLYTFSDSVLKISVFFPPLYPNESTKVQIEIQGEESGKLYKDECHILPFM